MKRIISLILTVAMLVSCTFVLAGCGAPADEGAQIKVYLGNAVYDFDPSDYYGDSNAEQLMSLLFEPLFYVNEKGELKNGAAQNYWIDEAENTITVELRESYWSDNSRVKAEDFVYAWCERILNPNNPNPAAALFYDIENAAAAKTGDCSLSEVGVVATGTYQLTITYREGADYNRLLRNLASVAASPVNQAVVSSAPTYWTKTINNMVSNGPFKVASFDFEGGELKLSRNMGYHQNPETVDYDNNVIPADLFAVFSTGTDSVAVSYADIESKTVFVMSDASVSDRTANKNGASVADDTSVYSYVFNTKNPLFAKTNVRRALSLAIDRQAIADAVVFGKAANGFIPDVCGGSAESLIPGRSNIATAQALLSQENLSGIDKAFTLSVNNDEESKVIAEMVAASWTQLGFDVTIEYLEPVLSTIADIDILDSGVQVALKEASYGNAEFDVLAVDWQLYSNDPFVGLAAFTSTLSGCGTDFVNNERRENVAGWFNSDYDFLVTEAMKSKGEDRAALLVKAEKLLCEEVPVCPILFNQSFVFTGSELSGLYFDGLGNISFTWATLANYHDYLVDVVHKEDEE